MPDFGRNEPSLDEIRRSDDFIDALAGGRAVAPQDSADAALAALLGNWRDEMRWPPANGLITEPQALAALEAGRSEKRPVIKRDQSWATTQRTAAKKSRRGLSVVGAAAAAVLSIGGFGAVVAGAGPGDALYGLRTMLFGAPKEVRDDQVALAARTEMQQVEEMISRGDWQQAQEKLVAVSTQVAAVGDQEQKQELLTQFNDLSAKVVERDPAATAPPGIIYTVPPEATDLVPVVAPPTTDSSTATSASESASTSPSTSPSTSASPSTSGSETTSAATSSAPGATTSTAPSASTSAAPATTSAAPASTSAAPATTSAVQQQQTTATSAAPATSSAAATTGTSTVTSAPKSAEASTPTTAATSTPPAAAASTPAATTTATSAPPPATTTVAPQAPAPATSSAAPTTAVPTVPEPVVTTTVVLPVVPAG